MKRNSVLVDFIIVFSIVALVLGIRLVRGTPPPVQIEPAKVRGNPNAKTFIVEFSDFACPYCNLVRPALKKVLDDHPNDLRILFKQFPLSIHPLAERAAEASECAADQGKFWEYNDYLFDHVQDWNRPGESFVVKNKFIGYASLLGLEPGRFQSCLESHEKRQVIEDNKREGRHLFVGGTPTCILNGRTVLTSLKPEKLSAAVEAAIKADNHP